MNKIQPLKSVYAYYFPEVRKIITDISANYPHETFLKSIDPGLDSFHEPVIEAYINNFNDQMPLLESFPYRYTSSGASESIFHVLSHIACFRRGIPLYVLEGEYEGYAGYGQNLGLDFRIVSLETDFEKLPPGIFFISNPSAKDGNILPNSLISKIGESGHEIVLDATYVGLTRPHKFLVNHPAISSVIVSLSKPYGLYYYRIGFIFTRGEIKTLAVNKWFKNILSLIIAKKVLTTFRSGELVAKYERYQTLALNQMTNDYKFKPQKSDVILLGYTPKNNVPPNNQLSLKLYDRGPNLRFCLTPYFLNLERRGL